MSEHELNNKFLKWINTEIMKIGSSGKSYRTLSLEDPGDRGLDKIVISDSRDGCDLVTFYNSIYYLKYILDTLLFKIFLRDDFILHTIQSIAKHIPKFPFMIQEGKFKISTNTVKTIRTYYYNVVVCLRKFSFFKDIQLLNTVLLFPYHFFTYILFIISEHISEKIPSDYGAVIIDAKKRTINQFRAIFNKGIYLHNKIFYVKKMLTFFQKQPENIIIFDKRSKKIEIDIQRFVSSNDIFHIKDFGGRVVSVPPDIERLSEEKKEFVIEGKVEVDENQSFTSLYKLLNMIDDIAVNNLKNLFRPKTGRPNYNYMKQIITMSTCNYIDSTFLKSDTDKIFLLFHEDFYRVGTVYLGMSRKSIPTMVPILDSLESQAMCTLPEDKQIPDINVSYVDETIYSINADRHEPR